MRVVHSAKSSVLGGGTVSSRAVTAPTKPLDWPRNAAANIGVGEKQARAQHGLDCPTNVEVILAQPLGQRMAFALADCRFTKEQAANSAGDALRRRLVLQQLLQQLIAVELPVVRQEYFVTCVVAHLAKAESAANDGPAGERTGRRLHVVFVCSYQRLM